MAADPPVDPPPSPPGRFKPGQSGNPGGRPKAEVRVRELARQRTEAAIETLTEIMLNRRAPAAARVSAAQAILDRAWGKPVQPNAFTDIDGAPLVLAEQQNDFEVARRIAFLLSQGMRAKGLRPDLIATNRENPMPAPGESSDESDT